MSEKLNLYQKIADVKANIDGFTKDTKGYNFSYVSGSQILHRIRTKMIEHNLLLVPSTTNEKWTTHTYKNKKGNEIVDFVIEMDLNYKWINADKPEEQLDISYHAFGQQSDISQAHGTALTYAERYFLMKFFNIPTDEDDADAKEKQDRYSKVDPKNIETLENEITMFSELMKSLGKEVSIDQVKEQLKITDINQLSNNQIAMMITTLDKWSKQSKLKENE
ncbi:MULTISPECIES: ERF family protein [Staphylococcus]|uniref:Single-stranded DNA-binding protein n=1 Tax=Staphylococcus pseudoxylosus TaxID=2282419 RepID=A0AAQ0MIW1_9STAP|nr:ERF family protein [Staphylococcus pseudoxylosus]MCE5001712.1 ERF family protein [Staphylococcus pseudoxylosus]RMI85629.1 single-stranded DNA-binding protein [Staphylococcus pseudoxylosus]